MFSFAEVLYTLRASKGAKIQDLAADCRIDPSLYSKYEHGIRLPSDKHLKSLVAYYGDGGAQLVPSFLAEKISRLIPYHINYEDVLQAAESRLEYLRSEQALQMPELEEGIQRSLDKLSMLKDKWIKGKPLDSTQLHKLHEYFNVQYTYDSNRIEGNTLTYQETHLVINEGITISGKSLKEHLEAINHHEAVDFVIGLAQRKEPFTEKVLLELHSLILKSIDSRNAGRYRTVPVRISGSDHMPPDPILVPELMQDYFSHYNLQKHVLHPVLLAAEMHERLVSIHPFVDGNGRTSRLVMNLILLSHGYTVTSLKGDLASRLAYYKALEHVQIHNEPDHFYRFIIEQVERSLENHLSLI